MEVAIEHLHHTARLTTDHPTAGVAVPVLILNGIPYKPGDTIRWQGKPMTAYQYVSTWQVDQQRAHDARMRACDAFLRPD